MATVEEILGKLQAEARPDQVEGMARYGMVADNRLGVSVPDMRKIAKEAGKDHRLALELWKTGIPEARISGGHGRRTKGTDRQPDGRLGQGPELLGRLRSSLHEPL